jgi:enoyl-CoA hydratase/carnithine racemase
MSSSDRVAYRVRDKVVVVALARPPVNAIDHPMIDAMYPPADCRLAGANGPLI